MKLACLYLRLTSLVLLGAMTSLTHAANEPTALQASTMTADISQPFSHSELQKASQQIQKNMDQKIESWGKSLTKADFERTWYGKQLTKPKRQEVCGIYQGVVNEMYALISRNKSRLTVDERKLLEDRNAFIQSLGFENNVVDTQMGFDCRLR